MDSRTAVTSLDQSQLTEPKRGLEDQEDKRIAYQNLGGMLKPTYVLNSYLSSNMGRTPPRGINYWRTASTWLDTATCWCEVSGPLSGPRDGHELWTSFFQKWLLLPWTRSLKSCLHCALDTMSFTHRMRVHIMRWNVPHSKLFWAICYSLCSTVKGFHCSMAHSWRMILLIKMMKNDMNVSFDWIGLWTIHMTLYHIFKRMGSKILYGWTVHIQLVPVKLLCLLHGASAQHIV